MYKPVVLVSCTNKSLNLFDLIVYRLLYYFSYFSWVHFHFAIANLMIKLLNFSFLKFTLFPFRDQSVVIKPLKYINNVSLAILSSFTVYKYIIQVYYDILIEYIMKCSIH